MNLVSEAVKLAENEWKNWNCIQEKIKQIESLENINRISFIRTINIYIIANK